MADPLALLTMAFDKVEVRTAFSPPVVIDLKGPSDPKTMALMREAQPALIFTGPAGRVQIAPYGVPEGSSLLKRWGWGLAVGGIGAALGLVFLGGALGRR
jgi:hypothetical protein